MRTFPVLLLIISQVSKKTILIKYFFQARLQPTTLWSRLYEERVDFGQALLSLEVILKKYLLQKDARL